MRWYQKKLTLAARPRGFHLVTAEILAGVPEIRDLRVGLLHLFLQHTSASLSVNENASPDVRSDMEMAFSRLVPESWPYRHTDEGADDMPAHVKAALLGPTLILPVSAGALALGTWQGLYLCEHRDAATPRTCVATLYGE